MKRVLFFVMLFSVLACFEGAGFGQTTTADGSLPGGANNSERMRAESDPFVKKNRETLKKAGLDPVSIERYAEQIKGKSSSQQLSFLQGADGAPLSTKGQVVLAFLFAKESGLKGSAVVKEMRSGSSLTDAIQDVAEESPKNKGTAAATAEGFAESKKPLNDEKMRKDLQSLAKTIQEN
jgi:hypothetical protein